jgi:hypothetical protein
MVDVGYARAWQVRLRFIDSRLLENQPGSNYSPSPRHTKTDAVRRAASVDDFREVTWPPSDDFLERQRSLIPESCLERWLRSESSVTRVPDKRKARPVDTDHRD